jgi:type II secretory pathway predicted ATPase ExeA
MYESFYGLKTKPFSMLPDPDFLYLGKKHRVALTLLEYALMNNAGFCVITGEIGAGKTTLLRKLLDSIEENITIGMITNTHQSFGELLDWVLSAFGIHQSGLSKVEMHQRFVDFLLEQYAKNKTTLLIVDEAQNMPATTLEELRMLSNINSEKDLVLQIILAGQPDLRDTLRKPELKQFAQRISVDFHLDALNLVETCHYIQHRLVTAGATNDIFTPEACRLIGEYSGGVPRLINLLCDTALVYGFADQAETIDAELIEELVSERMEHSILPLVKSDKSESTTPAENDNFPWINPEGGTKGLKPAAEKKTVEKAVTEIERAKDDASCDQGCFNPAEVLEADATAAEAPVVKHGVSERVTPIVQIPDEADIAGLYDKDSAEKDWPALFADDKSKPATGQAFINDAVKPVPESIDDQIDKSQFGNRMIIFALFVLALFLTLTTMTFNYQTPVSATAVNELAGTGIDNQQDEVEILKQDLVRMQQQAEDMQRERDAALAKARAEEEQRALQAQAALEAAKREKEAVTAAEVAADQALKAKEQAEAIKKKQRLEKRRLLDEWKQLELERQKAELEQQLLEEQRQTLEREQKRLIKEKAERQMRVLPEWGDGEL